MSSNTILVLIIAAVLALFSYAVITSNETAVVPTATTTVPDTSNSWKTNDSLKAKCDQLVASGGCKPSPFGKRFDSVHHPPN